MTADNVETCQNLRVVFFFLRFKSDLVLSCGIAYYAVQDGSKFRSV